MIARPDPGPFPRAFSGPFDDPGPFDPGPFSVPKRLRYVVRRDGEVLSLASLGKTCNRTAPVLPKWRRTPCKSKTYQNFELVLNGKL